VTMKIRGFKKKMRAPRAVTPPQGQGKYTVRIGGKDSYGFIPITLFLDGKKVSTSSVSSASYIDGEVEQMKAKHKRKLKEQAELESAKARYNSEG
jgi:hypothetical protein